MSRRLFTRFAALMFALLPLASLTSCGAEASVTAQSMAKASAVVASVNGLCPVMKRLVNENPEKWVARMKANPTKYGYKP